MKTTATKIIKSFTDTTRTPVSWLELACGHTGSPRLRDRPTGSWSFGFEHDDSNHLVKPGDDFDCERCDHQARAMETLRTINRAQISHSRFRHHDSRGFGPGSFYVYVVDRQSPTGCRLLLSLDDTPKARAMLDALRSSPLSPTEKR